ncbi:MAG TPA: hypothetical protein VFC53_01430 [Dehalococcoidia bacterium]|nr:hypothetical protein [Dehalococcoidia bacterium]
MLGELTAPRAGASIGAAVSRWHVRLQYAVASGALAGVAVLCALVLSKPFFLGSDSANDYAHVWYISDQLFHHARLPLHISMLERGDALTFPYAVVPWLVAAVPYALIGDRAVTIAMVGGFVLYGYAAVRARPALRDARLLALLYVNTFLIEGLVSFQLAFLYACAFFFLFVEATDRRRWPLAGGWALIAVTTHPFAAVPAIAGYALYAAVRRPRDVFPLAAALVVAALIALPYALYIRTAPAVATTKQADLVGTLKFMARFRAAVVLMPFILSGLAWAIRPAFLPAFLALALLFAHRIQHQQVNTFGLDRYSRPLYGEFLRSPQFDPHATYRVLEPNDREDGAYQLMRHHAVLAQEFFDQSQFRRWWNTPEQYACFLGAKKIDIVLLERDYPMKFSQNESTRLQEFEQQGTARVVYRDPRGRFAAYDVRAARRDGARMRDCGL